MKRSRPASIAARREALLVAIIWIITCVYTVGYCAGFAYRPGVPRTLMGVPEWVVWGVLAPWFASLAITLWFALRFMKDEPLGVPEDE